MLYFNQKKIKAIPSRSIVNDVAWRDGPATYESYSPFEGCYSMLVNQFNTDVKRRKFNLKEFVDWAGEFDPEKIGVVNETVDDTLEDEEDSTGALDEEDATAYTGKDLEGLYKHSPAALVKFFSIKLTQYFTYSNSPYNNQTINPLKLVGIDEKESEAELRVIEAEDAQLDELLRERLPYLIKRIHEKSTELRVSLFYLLSTYHKLVYEEGMDPCSIRPKQVYDYPYIHMNGNGNHDRLMDYKNDEKQPYAKVAREFLTRPDLNDPYYRNCMEFVELLDRAGIDMMQQDWSKFNSDFVQSIRITALPTDEEFFTDNEALLKKYLTPEMLFTPVEIATTHQSQDKVSNLVLDYDDKMKTVTYPLLERISQRDIVLQREMSQIDISDVNEFLNLYKLYVTGTKGDFDLKPGYGLVCDESGKPLSLVARTLVSSDDAFASDYLYLSYSGLLILTQFNETLLYTTVKKASEELRENIITGKRVSISLRKYTDETKIH